MTVLVDPDTFPAHVRDELRTWGAPGVEIAVVKDGVVRLADGYGRHCCVKRRQPAITARSSAHQSETDPQ